jgi:hypothetical protein
MKILNRPGNENLFDSGLAELGVIRYGYFIHSRGAAMNSQQHVIVKSLPTSRV